MNGESQAEVWHVKELNAQILVFWEKIAWPRMEIFGNPSVFSALPVSFLSMANALEDVELTNYTYLEHVCA